jgi:hypothetical protein
MQLSALSKAKERARRPGGLNNLKQMGLSYEVFGYFQGVKPTLIQTTQNSVRTYAHAHDASIFKVSLPVRRPYG